MTTPRPILKTRCPDECFPSPSTALPFKFLHSPHVHFPPTPSLADIQTTHSPFVYDRAPIIVSPNTCNLPERGGRVYSAFTMDEASAAPPKGSYFHPRAYEACEPEHLNEPSRSLPDAPPALISDFSSSSESEDSDVCASSPVHLPTHDFNIPPASRRDSIYPLTPTCPQDEALAFLPHPRSQTTLLKERAKPRRRGTGRSRPTALDVHESFASMDRELSLDGCLGGF
ncbi:hypothetical protein D9615_000940 [Tricholomella constricta]|uniref:Uncharacterized protein n=1 Tax=Tricholomella constricta TaxID=117010 RepID=A0A8H5M8N8_9AGAR|nr:hypothetical protein D9615_000940 [Tricholomella constricta]